MACHLQFIFMKIILDSSIIAMKHNAVAQQIFGFEINIESKKTERKKENKVIFKKIAP